MFAETRHTLHRLMPPTWRPVPALLAICVGIDLRRTASWIALAAGGWLGWWCSVRTAAGDGIAMLSAAVLAVASIGDFPLAVCLPAGRGVAFLWGCERATWPIVGVLCGVVATRGELAALGVMPAVLGGGLLATATTLIGRLSGAKAADAASLTLLLAAASAAAGGCLASRLGGACPAAVATWLLLGGLGWAWSQSQRTTSEASSPGGHGAAHAAGLHLEGIPADGALRQTLTRLAMVAALVAMVGWLMIEPAADPVPATGPGTGSWHVGGHWGWDRLAQTQRAAVAWALVTAAWFVGLAVPAATQFDGPCGVGAWDRLFRSAASSRCREHRGMGTLAGMPVGAIRFGVAAALASAAILGWPPLVGGLLSLSRPTLAWPPLTIALGLAAAAVALAGLVIVATSVGASRESLFAAILALVVAAAIPCLAALFGEDATRLPSASPIPPRSPSFGGATDTAATVWISC